MLESMLWHNHGIPAGHPDDDREAKVNASTVQKKGQNPSDAKAKLQQDYSGASSLRELTMISGMGSSKGSESNRNAKRRDSKSFAPSCYYRGRWKRHGTRVHEDMERAVKLIRQESNELGDHLGQEERWAYEVKRGDQLFHILKFYDPCVLSIIETFVARKWIPVISEFTIYDEWLRMATNIDMIAWDISAQKGIAVEMKTGHNAQTNYDAHDGITYMTTEHAAYCIKDTALNRAAIQLLIPLIVLKRRYGVDMEEAVIVRTASATACTSSDKGAQSVVSTKYCQLYKIPMWMANNACQNMLFRRCIHQRVLDITSNKKICSPEERVSLCDEVRNSPCQHMFWEPLYGYWNITVGSIEPVAKKARIYNYPNGTYIKNNRETTVEHSSDQRRRRSQWILVQAAFEEAIEKPQAKQQQQTLKRKRDRSPSQSQEKRTAAVAVPIVENPLLEQMTHEVTKNQPKGIEVM